MVDLTDEALELRFIFVQLVRQLLHGDLAAVSHQLTQRGFVLNVRRIKLL